MSHPPCPQPHPHALDRVISFGFVPDLSRSSSSPSPLPCCFAPLLWSSSNFLDPAWQWGLTLPVRGVAKASFDLYEINFLALIWQAAFNVQSS